ncbi:MAG: serine hydrolase domain-containing protein [Candidatus Cryptobacteroides sp.]|nr:serine hydrolase domain-containing protein [Candidatus Cryptobacteroides sp.]
MERPSSFSVLLLAAFLALGLAASCTRGQTPRPNRLNTLLTNELSDTSSLHPMDKEIETFLQRWCMKGASLAVMRGDSLLYAKGYGWADEEKGIKMSPGTLLRVASVSKLVTATGIMVLKERGLLDLEDKVFGPEGILNDECYTSAIRDKRYFRITVDNLLRHEGGFTVRGGDPLFSTREIMRRFNLDTPPDSRTLVSKLLTRPLKYLPGSSSEYSNLGYLLLSMIIEKITGEPYEDWMQDNVLRPAGCRDFHIAHNYYDKRYKGEARYYVQANDPEVPEYNGSDKMVTRCYGGNDIRALSGAGAWVTSVPELALLVASIDGRPHVPDILTMASVREMTRYYDDSTWSLGWSSTRPNQGWIRTGTLSGTSALIYYFPDGECWIIVTNTSSWKGPRFARNTKSLLRNLHQKYSRAMPERDFFYDSI